MVFQIPVRHIAIFVLMLHTCPWDASCTVYAKGEVVFESGDLVLKVSSSGRLKSLRSRDSGLEWARAGSPLCLLHYGKYDVAPVRMEHEGDHLTFFFGSTDDAQVTLAVTSLENGILIDVHKVIGNATSVSFASIDTMPADDLLAGRILSRGADFLGMVSCNTEVHIKGEAGVYSRLTATAYRDLPRPPGEAPFAHACAAIFASHKDKLIKDLIAVEQTLHIPCGMQTKTNPANARSYLFAWGVTAANVDDAIEFAERGGMGSILLKFGDWCDIRNSCAVNRRHYPQGLSQLTNTLNKIHDAGLLAGAHLHVSSVPKDSSYIWSRKGLKLYHDKFSALAVDLTETSTSVAASTSLSDWNQSARGSIIQIDDELIEYSQISKTPPYMFINCERGAYGTAPAMHRKDTPIARVVCCSTNNRDLIYDHSGDIRDRIAEDISRTYNEAGFDWLYFDGVEASHYPGWYTFSLTPLSIIQRLNRRPAVVQSSAESPFMWHLITRTGQKDYYWISMNPKVEIDYSVQNAVARAKSSIMAVDIGWFPFYVPQGIDRLPTIDEIEYLYVKALAVNASVSIQATVKQLQKLPHRDPILHIMRTLEELRLNNYFSKYDKAQAGTPGRDFMLIRDSGGSYFLRPASEVPYVAGSSREIRAFQTNDAAAQCTVSLWNVDAPVWLVLRDASNIRNIRDYLGNPVKAQTLPGNKVKILVNTRLYFDVNHSRNPSKSLRRSDVLSLN